ncbi:MAG: Tex-like N-terminal domain-containing protein, partial [Fusobacterium sp.]
MNNLFEAVAKELNLKLTQVENTVKLLDEGATVPFISRYRKEV